MLAGQFEQLVRYLPRDIYMGESLEYASYHSRAITVNGEKELYTFEYFAFHILWMSFMQKVAYSLYLHNPEQVKVAFSGEGNVMRAFEDAQSLYGLSIINEKKLCEIAKHDSIGFHHNKVDNLKDFVTKRDHIAHCSGVLDLNKEDVAHLVDNYLRYTVEIQKKLEPIILDSWLAFIEILHSGEQQYSLVHDAVIEYLFRENLSVADILMILGLEPKIADEGKLTERIARMQLALIIEDYSIDIEIDAEKFKTDAMKSAKTPDQKAQVQDESEAYNRFRIGLIK